MIFFVNNPPKFSHPFSATYCTCTNYEWLFQVHVTVKAGQATPQDSINELNIWKMNPLIVPVTVVKFKLAFLHAQWAVNIFTRTFLYLVRLKIFEWIKLVRRHLHQIQGNWAGRNFVTELRVNSPLITNAEMNLKSTTTNRFNFRIINSSMGSWGVQLTWHDCIFYFPFAVWKSDSLKLKNV